MLEDPKILEFNKYQISDNTSSIIYADLKSFIKRIDGFKINSENLSTTIVYEHIPSGYSMSTKWIFDGKENEHDVSRGEDCMKKFCESLREYAMEMISLEKTKMTPLTNKEQKSYEKIEISYISRKSLYVSTLMIKIIAKLGAIVNIPVNTEVLHNSICSLKYSIPNEIPVVFQNVSNYDYHFVITKHKTSKRV